jgi:3,4-dihydroxy-9,10-secoandrosta-1,3,5(10)-triene-9,17-dione 4,5-dioxygenase
MKIVGLGYVIIGTPDIAAWRDFANNVLGLAATEGPNGAVYLKMDERFHRYVLVSNPKDALVASGWEVAAEDDFKAAFEQAGAANLKPRQGSPEECALRKVAAFFSIADPSGNVIEVCWAPVSDFSRFVSPIGVARFVTGDLGMGHVVLPAPQKFDATRDFWRNVMGFGLSDFVNFDMGPGNPPVRICFLHCDNPRQHSVALAEMPSANACDHILVEVDSVDEVGRGLYRAQDHNIPMRVSLGRHINDEMFSFYMIAPGGITVEYGAGGKRIEDWSKHRVFEATRGSVWGHRFVPPAE